MAVTVSVDWDGSSLRIRYSGVFERRDANALALSFFEVIKARPEADRVLVDQRELVGRISPGELFFLLRDETPTASQEVRIAVLEREDEREYGAFFENVVANSRPGLRVFYVEEEAVRWLSSG